MLQNTEDALLYLMDIDTSFYASICSCKLFKAMINFTKSYSANVTFIIHEEGMIIRTSSDDQLIQFKVDIGSKQFLDFVLITSDRIKDRIRKVGYEMKYYLQFTLNCRTLYNTIDKCLKNDSLTMIKQSGKSAVEIIVGNQSSISTLNMSPVDNFFDIFPEKFDEELYQYLKTVRISELSSKFTKKIMADGTIQITCGPGKFDVDTVTDIGSCTMSFGNSINLDYFLEENSVVRDSNYQTIVMETTKFCVLSNLKGMSNNGIALIYSHIQNAETSLLITFAAGDMGCGYVFISC